MICFCKNPNIINQFKSLQQCAYFLMPASHTTPINVDWSCSDSLKKMEECNRCWKVPQEFTELEKRSVNAELQTLLNCVFSVAEHKS